MKSKWFELTEEEQQQFYKDNNIGGGFRGTMGGTQIVKDSELPPEIRKIAQAERKKLLERGVITQERYDELCNE